LANSFLTGRVVRPGADRDSFLALILSSFVILCILSPLGPWLTLGLGLVLSAGAAGGFSYAFIATALWIDPLIPGAAVLAGALASFIFALLAKNRAAYRFRKAYGPHIAPVYLKRLIKAYHPLPSETLSVRTAVVAVRDAELKSIETRSLPEESAAAALAFRKQVLNIFGREGGVVVGIEGDLVMIALGSPLERTVIRNMKTRVPYDEGPKPSLRSPAAKAMAIVRDIADHIPAAASWRFALDTGDCAFSYTEAAGYTAYGRPVVCARLFSSLASRYKARVLVTTRIMEQNPGLSTHKLGDLVESGGEDREGFYEALFGTVTEEDTTAASREM
jgi:class 3 adenylate cyclase